MIKNFIDCGFLQDGGDNFHGSATVRTLLAFAGIRTVTPKTRDGMVESLRVFKVCRKTAIAARRIALQMIQMNIISAPRGDS